jgi:hypothetical protein
MTMVAAAIPPVAPPPLTVRRFTVDEYHRMIAGGILTEDDPVELLEGWIISKMPHNPPHDATIVVAQEAMARRLPSGWHVRCQCAATMDDSEPEPDLMVVAGAARDYLRRLPSPPDIALVVEASDTTLGRDRQHKGRLYARAGIPIFWVINLADMRVEVYEDPTGPSQNPEYRQRRSVTLAGEVPLVLGGQQVATLPARDLMAGTPG